jgi:hypothetical protein
MNENLSPSWMEGVKPPFQQLIRCGSIEQFYRAAFTRGALDFGREAWRVCCPTCRPLVQAIANRYHGSEAA